MLKKYREFQELLIGFKLKLNLMDPEEYIKKEKKLINNQKWAENNYLLEEQQDYNNFINKKCNFGNQDLERKDLVFIKIKPELLICLSMSLLILINIISFVKKMQKQNQSEKQIQNNLLEELREFGFLDQDIHKALKYTQSKQIAAQIIVKLMQQGPDCDLSMYIQQIAQQKKQQTKVQNKLDRPKMLFVINGSLKMGKGKICAQVGHAVIGAYLQIEEQAKFDQRAALRLNTWQSVGQMKVVVKAQSQQQMMEIQKKLIALNIGINTYIVEDAGHTQIKAGSKTILAIGPAFSSQIDPITQNLKLA